MAIEVGEVTGVSALVGDLARREVSDLSQGELLAILEAVARLGRLTDTLRARCAGEVARRSAPEMPGGGLARAHGFGNAAAMVAKVTGGSQAGAWRAIEAGLALMPDVASAALVSDAEAALDPAAAPGHSVTPPTPRYPAVAGAALAGELSVDAAGLITAGLETLTDRLPSDDLHELEQRLVAKAVGLTAHEVRRLVLVAVARADVAGLRERERRQHAERFFTWAEDNKGMVSFTGRMDAVTAAPIRTVIEQVVTQQFRHRRDQDPLEPDKRTVGQMRADALFDICRHALGCKETDRSGVRTTIVVRMNLSDVDGVMGDADATGAGGAGAGTGLGSIDGTTVPVSVGELRRLSGDAGVIPAVLGGDSEVLDLGRKVRMFTTAQRLALVERDGGCAKCHAPPEHCEAHHIRWWEHGGTTDLSNGVLLCTRCHHDIHRQGWEIVIEGAAVTFVPPGTIDPLQRAVPGGIAAITIDHPDMATSAARENSAQAGSGHEYDTTKPDTRENSARAQDIETGALRDAA